MLAYASSRDEENNPRTSEAAEQAPQHLEQGGEQKEGNREGSREMAGMGAIYAPRNSAIEGRYEETQQKLQKELDELLLEEKRLQEQEDMDMEAPEAKKDPVISLEEMVAEPGGAVDTPEMKNKGKLNEALVQMQKKMESEYQQRLEQDRLRMHRPSRRCRQKQEMWRASICRRWMRECMQIPTSGG